MKNIIKGALLLLLAGGAVACNLNKYPSNAIPEDKGFTTFQDAKEFRNSIYYMGRSSMTDVIVANMQCEGINATLDYGNNYGQQYAWTFTDSDESVTNIWTNDNTNINQINYFLAKCEELIANDANLSEIDPNKMSAQDLKDLNLYIGEARFFRALLRHHLVQYFCKDYNPETASQDWGIILKDDYDIATRLGRSKLDTTYVAINADIDFARTALETYYGKGGNPSENYYLGTTAVECLTAYVQLETHQYTEAAATAASIVDNTKFALINNATDFASMWKNNTGSELIFQFFASLDEGSVKYGDPFLYDPYGNPDKSTSLKPQYVPAQYLIDQYSNNGDDAWVDMRSSVYFTPRACRIGTTAVTLKLFNKYPGNPAYDATTGINSLGNNVPCFRTADFALIAAEAYYMAGDEGNANNYLKKLREARISSNSADKPYVYPSYSGEELLSEIKMERLKEMIMEGNRLADLKRWGDPMSRLGWTPQNESLCVTIGMYTEIPANDYRFVWPIPQDEYTNNPALNGQLNWK